MSKNVFLQRIVWVLLPLLFVVCSKNQLGMNKPPNVYINAPNQAYLNRPMKIQAVASDQDGTIKEYLWKFGTAPWVTTSGPDTLINAPATPQQMICSIRVADNGGLNAYDRKIIYIDYAAPTPKLTPEALVASILDTVRLTASATDLIDSGRIIDFEWKIGYSIWKSVKKLKLDTLYSDTIITMPSTPQTLVCSLRVTDNDGIAAYRQCVITVVNKPSTAIADADPRIAFTNSPVKLIGNAVLVPGDVVTQWAWKIGYRPWTVTSTKDTTVLFDEVGTFLCSLRVTDFYGIVSYASVTVTIKPSIIQAVAGSNIRTGLNDPVQLRGFGLPADQIVLYRWKIHTYPWKASPKDTVIISAPAEQTWLCSLEVTDKFGQVARDGMVLYSISKPPIAKAMAEPMIAPVNSMIRVLGEGTDEEGIISYAWKIGDYPWRETAKDSLIRVPPVQGLLRCSLRVTDRDFEIGTSYIDVRISASQVIAYAGEDTIVGIDSDFRLHGQELSGTATVSEWWWKIDRYGVWRRTSSSDTVIRTPAFATTLVCSLRVITNNSTEGIDEKILYVKSGQNNRVVYTKSDMSIYTNNFTFNAEEEVNTNGDDPKWSPDGSRIAFNRQVNNQNYIYVMDWNGNNVRQLVSTAGGTDACWYNDNRTLAYAKYSGSIYSINRVDIDGNNNVQLFSLPNRKIEQPFVNPANQDEIAFFNSSVGSTTSSLDNRHIYIHRTGTNENIKILGNTSGNQTTNRLTRENLSIFGDRLLWDATQSTTHYLQTMSRNGDSLSVIQIEAATGTNSNVRGVYDRLGTSIYYFSTTSSMTTFYRSDLLGNNKQTLNSISGRVIDLDVK